MSKGDPKKEDYVIEHLETLRWDLVRMIADIDKAIDNIRRKDAKKKVYNCWT